MVSGDPFSTFPKGFLIWVRECYLDLKEILAGVEVGMRFVLLGTSTIGKSYFSIFWICYWATMKKRVVWKINGDFYFLDFSNEVSSAAYGPYQKTDSVLKEVFEDPHAWLIIDGAQKGGFTCACHILVPCSAQRDNYFEFSKNHNVKLLYVSIWEEEEIREFLAAFDEHRTRYLHMPVPDRERAMDYFEQLGGVPRYVLSSRKAPRRIKDIQNALGELRKDTCLAYLSAIFDGGAKEDAFVHMKCGQVTDEKNEKNGKYLKFVHVIASNLAKQQLKEFRVIS